MFLEHYTAATIVAALGADCKENLGYLMLATSLSGRLYLRGWSQRNSESIFKKSSTLECTTFFEHLVIYR